MKPRFPHRTATRAVLIVLAAIIVGAVLEARGRKADLTSAWRAGETIAIDGVNQEWQGKLTPIKDTRVSMAFANDGDALYLCLTTADRATRGAITRQGLTIWFDPEGGKKKVFGIEYPLGLPGMLIVERSGETGQPSVSDRPVDADRERLAIRGPGKSDHESLWLEQAGGIQARFGDENGVLVYEMKVPLHKTQQARYAVGAASGASIGIGLETPEFQRPQGRGAAPGGGMGAPGGGGRGPGGGGWGGGMGGAGGGMGGPGGSGPPPGGRGEMPKPLKQWTSVQLATGR